MPRLSIVIAACDNHQRLETSLVSVLENRPDDCEVLVVHDGSYDDPYLLKDEVTFFEDSGRTSWIEKTNLALRHCAAEVVHLLDCGVRVREGWAELALRHFDDPAVASVAPLVVDAGDPRRVLSAGLDYRRSGSRKVITRVRTSCQGPQEVCGATRTAAFYRRSVLRSIGGLPGGVGDRLADVDLALTIARMGLLTHLEPTSVVLADSSPTLPETTFRSGLYAERLYRRNRQHNASLLTMIAHGLAVTGEAISCLWQPAKIRRVLGRMFAVCGMGSYRKHRRWLQELETRQVTGDISCEPEAIAFPSPVHQVLRTLDETSQPISRRRAA